MGPWLDVSGETGNSMTGYSLTEPSVSTFTTTSAMTNIGGHTVSYNNPLYPSIWPKVTLHVGQVWVDAKQSQEVYEITGLDKWTVFYTIIGNKPNPLRVYSSSRIQWELDASKDNLLLGEKPTPTRLQAIFSPEEPREDGW